MQLVSGSMLRSCPIAYVGHQHHHQLPCSGLQKQQHLLTVTGGWSVGVQVRGPGNQPRQAAGAVRPV